MNLMLRLITVRTVIVVLSVLYISATPHVTHAKNIVIEPAYQTIDIQKGETAQATITLTNNTNTPVTFNLFTLNFTQNENGVVEFLGKDATSYSYALASYISLPQDSITVEAQSKDTVTITINDRQDLSPGGHYAAVVAQAEGVEQVKSATQFTPALASLLLLRKTGGEIFNLSLKQVSWPFRIIHVGYPKSVSLTFQNEGNIHVIPRGRVEIYDIFGRLTYKGVLNTASKYIFPSSRRTIDVPISRVAFTLPVSIDRIIVKGNDSLNKVSYTYQETYVYIHPLFAGIAIVAALLLCYIVFRLKKV
ncbi:MAG: hypothetical protein UZ22_OP11002000869 [Microgenomates bacterium OLB23]|nr:MAG: hypothetical protein UZ22_OP11002000869 [Microgenomates bacterium OLB23]